MNSITVIKEAIRIFLLEKGPWNMALNPERIELSKEESLLGDDAETYFYDIVKKRKDARKKKKQRARKHARSKKQIRR